MIFIPHILAGALIGSRFSSPIAIFVISFFVHYFLDALPHAEYSISALKKKSAGLDGKTFATLIKILLDFSIGTGIAVSLLWNRANIANVFVGIFSSLLPDALLFLSFQHPDQFFLKIFSVPHHALHYLKDKSPVWLGLVVEIGVSITLIILLAQSL